MTTLIDNSPVQIANTKPTLVGLTLDELKVKMGEIGVPEKMHKMRATQLFRWIYHYGITDFEAITDINKELRQKLAQNFTLERAEVLERLISKDGTRKWLIRTAPGIEIEIVYIPDVARSGALCVSSQVGCTLNCSFCHTGTQVLVRNLTAQEIIMQLMIARDDLGEWPTPFEDRQITNIVFMGMGEPLYNLDNVASAIEVISNGEGIAIGRRRITVSTSGIVPEMDRLGQLGVMLAVSLHACNDELRDILVPINKKYNLEALFKAIRAYPDLSNSKRVTFEYVMLEGVNDSPKDAQDLLRLLKGIPAKVNLIPFNPWPGSIYKCSDRIHTKAFSEFIFNAGISAPIRRTRGQDILAACGQLRSESKKTKASILKKENI
ncbi:MAG: 23S rRNA (adenine(2503)-C(2))-methyltransferase RlmN [Caulobacterales bacterium]|nr:23S rRNA (adenine(2503)-C(2))-methyltransferase RlmN [Caulobacterales bacterium]MCA0372192.1 23S rRNA (adenine(2503)-C(2))-methyltransferase RlmN [Pseudomonadota bacterium]